MTQEINAGNAVVLTFDRWFGSDTVASGGHAVNLVGYIDDGITKSVIFQDDTDQTQSGGLRTLLLNWIEDESNSLLLSSQDATLVRRVTSLISIRYDSPTSRHSVNDNSIFIDVFPNPVTSNGTLQIVAPIPSPTEVELKILDELGRQVLIERMNNPIQGIFTRDCSLPNLVPGLYFLKLSFGDSYGIKQIVVYD